MYNSQYNHCAAKEIWCMMGYMCRNANNNTTKRWIPQIFSIVLIYNHILKQKSGDADCEL